MLNNIISDSIYDVLLLEAKTPEEILKVTKYKYKDTVPEKFIDDVFSIDPTKKKSFTRWACEIFKQGDRNIVNDLIDGTLAKLFDFFAKNSSKFSLSDIKTLQEAKDYAFKTTLNDLLEKTGDGPENDFEYTDVDDKWGVAKYNTYEASKKLGRDCVWCTANHYGNGEYYYNDYTSNGDIFILFDKTDSEYCKNKLYTFKRYQIFFSNNISKKNEFNDSKNQGVEPEEVGFTDKLYEFFEEKGFDVKDSFLDEEERYERYLNWRYENVLMSIEICGKKYYVMPEYDETHDIRNIEDCYFCVYDDDIDDTLEIPWSPTELKGFYEEANILVSRSFTVLESNNDTYVFYEENGGLDGGYDDSEFVPFGESGNLKYFWLGKKIVFENDTITWDIYAGNEGANDIIIPMQKNNDEIYFNACSNSGYTYLFKLSSDGTYNVEKYVYDGIFVLKNGEYIPQKTRNNGMHDENAEKYDGEAKYLIDGKYMLMGDTKNKRFVTCFNVFCKDYHDTNIYDTQEKKLVFEEPYSNGFECCGLFIMKEQHGQRIAERGFNCDIFNSKTCEKLFSNVSVEGRDEENGRFVFKKPNGEIIFVKVNNGEIKTFFCEKIIKTSRRFFLVLDRNENKVLLDTIYWEKECGVKYFDSVSGYYTYVDKRNFCYIINPKDGKKQNIGKVSDEPYVFSKENCGVFLLFKLKGDEKSSLLDCDKMNYNLRNYISYVRLGYPFNNTSLIGVQNEKDKIQIFNLLTNKFEKNGVVFNFDEITDKLSIKNDNVELIFGIYWDNENPVKLVRINVYENGKIKRGISFPVEIYNDTSYHPDLYGNLCDEDTFKKIMQVKKMIEPNNNLNEKITRDFYSLLERLEKSKYNLL